MRSWIALLLALAALCFAGPGWAHLTPNSEVRLDFGEGEVRAEVIIPLGDYAAASGNPVDGSRASRERAAAFLRGRVRATTPSGEAWGVTVERTAFVQIAGPPDLHAVLRLVPPAGANARRFTIEWRAVVDTVPGHFALFLARSDFSVGELEGEGRILGTARAGAVRLTVDRGTASRWAGFGAAVRLGAHHIAEGFDHLLFLVALLIPAPLMARGGRWAGTVPPGRTLWRLAGIVTAFTVGHSITLIGGVLLGWSLPEQPVEIAIAASILVSAIHAWRPIFPGREAWVAGGFGLVHGLAFATLAGGFGIGLTEQALATLGFNLGVELFQLVVVAAVLPLLLLLSAMPAYAACRGVAAGLAGLAALATGDGNQVAAAAETALGYSPYLVALATAAVALVRLGWKSRQPAGADGASI
jgi:hypothetical protein